MTPVNQLTSYDRLDKLAAFHCTRQLMDWSYLCINVMFLSALWTLILTAPIHCRGSTGEQVM